MKFDELTSAWKEQNDRPLSPADREAVVVRVCRRVERLGGTIFRRDLIETIAAVFLIFWFGRMLITAGSVVAKVGAGLLVVWAGFIVWKMNRTRTLQRPAPIDAPVREFCRIELARLDRQIEMLRGVRWWYIAPCMVGANLVFIGGAGFGVAALGYVVMTLLLAWGIYVLNMRAIAKTLTPARDELSDLLVRLDEDDVDVNRGAID